MKKNVFISFVLCPRLALECQAPVATNQTPSSSSLIYSLKIKSSVFVFHLLLDVIRHQMLTLAMCKIVRDGATSGWTTFVSFSALRVITFAITHAGELGNGEWSTAM